MKRLFCIWPTFFKENKHCLTYLTIQAVVILTEPGQRSVLQSNSTFHTAIMYEQKKMTVCSASLKSITRVYKTSTLLYRSCAALAHFSGTFGFRHHWVKRKEKLEFYFKKLFLNLCLRRLVLVWTDGLDKQTK